MSRVKHNNLKPSDFVHLHNHTTHSVLDGMTQLSDLVNKVKEFGMEAAAITDHGTLSGLVDYYMKAKKVGIKPILGIETYVAARGMTDRDPQKDKQRFHLTVLAMNNTGFHNLIKLSTKANLEGMYYKPRVDHQLLEELNEGLIVLSGCASGEVGEALKTGDLKKAIKIAKWYKSIFGDRYYLEMQDHGHPKSNTHWNVQEAINEGVKKISKELDIPLVVTCDGHYLEHSHREAHEILLCVGTGSFLSDKNRMSLSDFELHLTDPRDIIDHWGDECPEAILNTKKIADRCNVEVELGRILIPKYPLPKGESEHSYLNKLTYQGLAVRYGKIDAKKAKAMGVDEIKSSLQKEVVDRAEMELNIISSMGYEGYFLIVQDFINWGKSRGIVFGPGRGSAAGSIVSYAINITDLDPLAYDLLFERFLNPDRISMPDIDVDMQDSRRDEVIDYCANKYGRDHVCNILTFGTMASRAAVRDVARVLEVPYAESDRLAKMVPSGPQSAHHATLKEAVTTDPDMKKEYENNPVAKEVYDFAIQLEGTIRSHGVHACGVVIAPEPLDDLIPLEMAQKGVVSTQFPAPEIEELGLLKMDFLGLSNLTIIDNCKRIIKKVYGDEVNLDTLPLDDKKTYELLQRGDTTGVFQLESAGMKRYLKELKPTHFEDIIAMVALYRPGPMQFIESFIKRKHGEEPISYLHPAMKDSLKDTYGVLVYQEQFMKISKDVCGFTGGQADTLRKAVAKKKIKLMEKMKPEFIDGAVRKSGADRQLMEKFWTQLEDFASYCFNKSHAACYALIAYWTAYLKAHYPNAFMAALMTSDAGNTDRLTIEISECNKLGLRVLNPDINESFNEFAVVPDTNDIRFGLSAIKSVGSTAIDDILAQKKLGDFKSIEDFASRVNSRVCNRKVWESLIKAGAFDKLKLDKPLPNGFVGDRSDLLFNLDRIIAFAQKTQKEAASGQSNLIDMLSVSDDLKRARTQLELIPAPRKTSNQDQLAWERELMGLYLSAHPLDRYDTYLKEQSNNISSINSDQDGAVAVIAGLLVRSRTIATKKGDKMAFIGLEDKTDDIEVVVFPSIYSMLPDNLDSNIVLKIKGRISGKDRDGNRLSDPSIIAESIEVISEDVLNGYQPTGVDMAAIDLKTAIKKKSYSNKKIAQKPSTSARVTKNIQPDDLNPVDTATPKILYIHVKDPRDSQKLLAMKERASQFKGDDQVILVLGKDKKDAIRLPFSVTACEELRDSISNIYGEDCVAIK